MDKQRERLIELLNTKMCLIDGNWECFSCKYDGKEDCSNARFADLLLANGVTFAEDNNVLCKWIPASEPPKESGYYLVAYKDKYNGSRRISRDFYAKCNVGEWWENDFGRIVTHWMLLPEPPKERDEQ